MADWGIAFLELHKGGISRVTVLSDSWGRIARSGVFQGIFSYASRVYTSSSSSKKTGENIKDNLERYLTELQRTADILQAYAGDKEKQRDSVLWQEVGLGFLACEKWMEAIKNNKVPRDIEESLVRKTGRLQSKIHLESLEQLNEASKRFDKAYAEAKKTGDAKHPIIYYAQGKKLFNDCQWYESKGQFLNYVTLLEGGDKRCRVPSEDNAYYYLSYIEEQMKLQNITAETNPLLSRNPVASIAPDERKNPYEVKYKEWVAKHPPSKDALESMKGYKVTPKKKTDEKERSSTFSPPTSPPPHPLLVPNTPPSMKKLDVASPTASPGGGRGGGDPFKKK